MTNKPTVTTNWLNMATAPTDGRKFIARSGERVFTAFYKENNNYHAKRAQTLQILIQPHGYSAAGNWFVPTHWKPLEDTHD